jgi:co-chaperonin GroES (HSP10)
MTVDVNDPRATILGKHSGETETAKSGIVVPHMAEEKAEGYEALDAGAVEIKERPLLALDVKADDRNSTRIQIDEEGHLIISEEEHLATLSGIARVASGNKPIPESKGFQREGAFHWQEKP